MAKKEKLSKVVERNILRWRFAGTGGMNMTDNISKVRFIVRALHVVRRRIIVEDTDLQETTQYSDLAKSRIYAVQSFRIQNGEGEDNGKNQY